MTGVGTFRASVGAMQSFPSMAASHVVVSMALAAVCSAALVLALVAWRRANRKRKGRGLAFHAWHDPLTGLPNRAYVMHELNGLFAPGERPSLAVLFIDLDGFKAINDIHGHQGGDMFLRAVGRSLRQSVRERDIVARFGGDEFVVVLRRYSGEENLSRICRKVLDLVSRPVQVGGELLAVSPSIGVAVAPRDGHDAETLLRNADAAMYSVKETGKADFRFYVEGMHELARERMALALDLRQALQQDDIEVAYQPKRCLRSGQVRGLEALARWNHASRGDVPPTVFVPVAERSGLIHALGETVLRRVLAQLAAWDLEGVPVSYVAINLSLHELTRPSFVESLAAIVARSPVDPSRIRFELTESSQMRQPEESVRQMHALREQGFALLIDDFGAGFWNLGHLRELPVGTIKIDQSFVRGGLHNDADRQITEAIVRLARKLRLETVAEGVETADQANWLRELGCDVGQGFYFAHPMPPAAVGGYLERLACGLA
jgi:diguanylate cyclase (GGDEF)-like protein